MLARKKDNFSQLDCLSYLNQKIVVEKKFFIVRS